jgi:hypothetical protein
MPPQPQAEQPDDAGLSMALAAFTKHRWDGFPPALSQRFPLLGSSALMIFGTSTPLENFALPLARL